MVQRELDLKLREADRASTVLPSLRQKVRMKSWKGSDPGFTLEMTKFTLHRYKAKKKRK